MSDLRQRVQRSSSPSFSEEYDADRLIALDHARRTTLTKHPDGAVDPLWKYETNLSDGIEVFSRAVVVEQGVPGVGNELRMVCGITYMRASPECILSQVQRSSNWKTWDGLVSLVESVPLNEHQHVVRLSLRQLWPYSARELVYLQTAQHLDDGALVMGTRSVEHPAFPRRDSHTRMYMLSGGWHLRGVEGELNQTKVAYFVALDPCLPLVSSALFGLALNRLPAVLNKVRADVELVAARAVSRQSLSAKHAQSRLERQCLSESFAFKEHQRTALLYLCSAANAAGEEDKTGYGDAFDRQNHHPWKFVKELADKIKVYQRQNVGGNGARIICGRGIIRASAQRIMAEVALPANWAKWDSLLDWHDCKQLTPVHRLVHLIMKPVFPYNARDSVFLETSAQLVDGSICLATCGIGSLDIEGVPEVQPHITRVKMLAGGWHIRPLPGSRHRCQVTYLLNMDPQIALVPSWVLDGVAVRVPAVINKVRQGIIERPEVSTPPRALLRVPKYRPADTERPLCGESLPVRGRLGRGVDALRLFAHGGHGKDFLLTILLFFVVAVGTWLWFK